MLSHTALLLCDLQNDFIHPDGAYGRAGKANADIAALPGRLAPVAAAVRQAGGYVGATLFTLVPGREGQPLISAHLQRLRPFLGPGDFAPSSWGQAVVNELQPVDFTVEKVAYSAFYESRLSWVLKRLGVETLILAGIVTNGGVASTLRDAHIRDFHLQILSDGCAAFDRNIHEATLVSIGSIAECSTCEELLTTLKSGTASTDC